MGGGNFVLGRGLDGKWGGKANKEKKTKEKESIKREELLLGCIDE